MTPPADRARRVSIASPRPPGSTPRSPRALARHSNAGGNPTRRATKVVVARSRSYDHFNNSALRRPVEPNQYTSEDYLQQLDDARVLASVGTVGDAYDNALAESFVDSFKTELIADRVWRTHTQLELAVVEYVAWFNHVRLHSSLGNRPPAEHEQRYVAALATHPEGVPRPTGTWHLERVGGVRPLRGRLRPTVVATRTNLV